MVLDKYVHLLPLSDILIGLATEACIIYPIHLVSDFDDIVGEQFNNRKVMIIRGNCDHGSFAVDEMNNAGDTSILSSDTGASIEALILLFA
jgi:hypothetical protein